MSPIKHNPEELEVVVGDFIITDAPEIQGRLAQIREQVRIHGVLESQDCEFLLDLIDTLELDVMELQDELSNLLSEETDFIG